MKSALVTSLAMHAGLVGGLVYCLENGGESSINRVLDAFQDASTSPIHVVWANPAQEAKTSLKKCNNNLSSDEQHPRKINDMGSGAGGDAETLAIKKISSLSLHQRDESHGKPFIPHPANQAPTYPDEAREIGLEGNGLVRLYLTKSGTVERVEKRDSLSDLLFQAAQKTLRTWRFTGNLPQYVDVPVEFRLNV